MSGPALNFTPAEYAMRLARVRAEMQRRGLELLVVSDTANMAWLTGYDGWSFYAHQAVLVALEGEPVWFGRGIDVPGARRTTYLHCDNIVGYPDRFVQSSSCHPMEVLAQVVVARGWELLVIGVEMDNYWFSAAAYAALRHGLPNARFVDATALVNWQRAVKSPAELAYMRKAAGVTETIFERIFARVQPGLRKNELVAEIYQVGIEGIDGLAGDYPAIVPLLGAGAAAACPHLTWNEQPLKAGEGVFFEISGCIRRYHSPLSRTVHLGRPTQAWLTAEAVALEGLQAGLAAARPGNTCGDIARAYSAVLQRHGLVKESRCGYPVGLAYPPDWGERTMSLRSEDCTELQPNMTFHFMPVLWQDTAGLEITETIVITETGAECLASVPRELFVKY